VKARYVLDTHALVWSVLSPDKLGSHARRAIEAAGPGELAITSATIMELGRLIADGKIDLGSRRPSGVFEDALTYNAVIPASLEAAIKAPVLGLPHSDPYDRLIVAEALVLRVPLITKDGNITDSGLVRVIW
jgi:PIN domain nuclease of toxin-antitoxin system